MFCFAINQTQYKLKKKKKLKQVVLLLSFPVAICKQGIQVSILCLALQWAQSLEFVIKMGFRIKIKFLQFTNTLNTYLCL